MQKTQLVLFNKENTKTLLSQFGFQTNKLKSGNKQKEVVVNQNNDPIQCPTCDRHISVKKVGTMAHGSRILFCDNPLCFATWLVEHKIK